jgi:inosose dehydratase
METTEQRFEFGYELITWEFGEQPAAHGLEVIAAEGFGCFEALLGDTLGADFSRRVMTLGYPTLPETVSDVQLLDRLAMLTDAPREHGIRLASLFCDGEWVNPHTWAHELAKAKVVAHILHSVGARIFVCGGGPPQLGRPRSAADYADFAQRLHELGAHSAELGIRTVYHPHIDTFVETREQLDRLMDVLDTGLVGLCIDPAHFQVKREDPVDIFRTYASAIDYVHLKDCTGDESTLTGYDRYLAFSALGTGIIDLKGITAALLASGYDGLVIVELDYSEDPDGTCRQSAAYIRETLGLTLTLAGSTREKEG